MPSLTEGATVVLWPIFAEQDVVLRAWQCCALLLLFKPCKSKETLAWGDEREQDSNNTIISSDDYFTKQLSKDNGGGRTLIQTWNIGLLYSPCKLYCCWPHWA